MRYELKTMGQHWYDDYITYAICFSERGDSLSQWRGYADDGSGVCIGFRADRISGMLGKNRESKEPGHTFEFARIRYTPAAQRRSYGRTSAKSSGICTPSSTRAKAVGRDHQTAARGERRKRVL